MLGQFSNFLKHLVGWAIVYFFLTIISIIHRTLVYDIFEFWWNTISTESILILNLQLGVKVLPSCQLFFFNFKMNMIFLTWYLNSYLFVTFTIRLRFPYMAIVSLIFRARIHYIIYVIDTKLFLYLNRYSTGCRHKVPF